MVDTFIADLEEAVEEVRNNPELAQQGGAAMYGLVAHMPLRGMVRKNVLKMMEGMYGPQGEMPSFANQDPAGESEDAVAKQDLSMKAGLLYLKVRNFFKKN